MSNLNNRRAHPRYPVNLDAELRYGRAQTQACRVRDLCMGGALVTCTRVAGVVVGSHCEISLRLREAGGEQQLRLACEVAHVLDGGFGARFIHLDARTLESLRGLLQEQERASSSLPQQTAVPAGRVTEDAARALLQRVTLRCLPALVESLMGKLEIQLWTYWDRLGNDAERGRLIQDLRFLERAHLEQRMQEGLRRALLDPMGNLGRSTGESSPPTSQELDAAQLELVDTERFDTWLAMGTMSTLLEDALMEPLRLLRSQAVQVFSKPLPVEPQGFAQGLGQVMQALGLGSATQVLCFRFAGPLLRDLLGAYYQEVIQAWKQAGLAPAAPRLRVITCPGNPSAPPQTGTPAQATPADVPAAVPDTCEGSASSLAPVAQDPAPLAAAAVPSAVPAAPSFLASRQAGVLLASLPPDALGHGELSQSLKQRVVTLLREAAPGDGVALPEARLEDRVDVTDQVLNRMLDDPQIPVPLKDWIQRLAMRFLAAAVLDPAFYGEAGHPLLELINGLEHLAQFLMPGDLILQGDLERLVTEALRLDGADLEALRTLTSQAAGLRSKFGGEFQRNAERVVARSEGRERLREARRQARERLNQFLVERPVHRVVDELVREAWWPLLQLAYLREGEQGPAWQNLWQLLPQLVESRRSSTGQTSRLQMEPRRLLAKVGEGLTYIGFDPLRRRDLLLRLGHALQRIRTGTVSAQEFVEFKPLALDAEEQREQAMPPGVAAERWRQALNWADQLALGSSVRFKSQGQGREQNLRLIWRSRDASELVFVNPRGFHARTLERAELALSLLHGKAEIHPPLEEPITERAELAALREMRERINYHETHDLVTGLKNRRQLLGHLAQSLDASRESFQSQVLAFMDLDHFELVNSACGYGAGEKMLATGARQLEDCLGEVTCLAYMGGNRFGLLAPAVDAEAGLAIGAQIRASLGAVPFHWHGKSYPMMGSLGLVWVGAGSDNPEQLLSAADAACRVAHQEGGDRILLFQAQDERIVRQRERLQWWAQAEQTVKQERLRLRAQRITPAEDGNGLHHHYEVLLSVYDEQGAPLPLGAFIASAEAFNLMADLDRLVIRKALAWLQAHFDKVDYLGGLAINLSGQSLGNTDLVDYVREQLTEYGIPPSLISFEVTETTAIANLDWAVTIIEGIESLGCRFALDDFGVGMSSYSYLKRLPVHYLKIDGSFVRNLLSNPHDQAIVKSINEIAHFMGKQTIAEFVESPEIMQWLRDIGVDYLQGHAVEKPLFLDELAACPRPGAAVMGTPPGKP